MVISIGNSSNFTHTFSDSSHPLDNSVCVCVFLRVRIVSTSLSKKVALTLTSYLELASRYALRIQALEGVYFHSFRLLVATWDHLLRYACRCVFAYGLFYTLVRTYFSPCFRRLVVEAVLEVVVVVPFRSLLDSI